MDNLISFQVLSGVINYRTPTRFRAEVRSPKMRPESSARPTGGVSGDCNVTGYVQRVCPEGYRRGSLNSESDQRDGAVSRIASRLRAAQVESVTSGWEHDVKNCQAEPSVSSQDVPFDMQSCY